MVFVEQDAPVIVLDERHGRQARTEEFSPAEGDASCRRPWTLAVDVAGVRWEGQEFHITGNPLVSAGCL